MLGLLQAISKGGIVSRVDSELRLLRASASWHGEPTLDISWSFCSKYQSWEILWTELTAGRALTSKLQFHKC